MRIVIILLLALLFSFSCKKQKSEANYVFAEINGNSFVYIKDTLEFKAELTDLLFSDTLDPIKPEFNIVDIRKQKTYGDTVEDYYFVLAQDIKQHIKVAKWLEKKGSKLYVLNKANNEEMVKLYYIACIGKNDCSPEVSVESHEKYWGCSRDSMCKKDSRCIKIIGMQ